MPFSMVEAVETRLTPDVVAKVAGSTGETTGKTKAAMSAGVLAIVAGLIRRVSSKGGAAHLLSFLNHDEIRGYGDPSLTGSGFDPSSLLGHGSRLMPSLLGSHADGLTDIVARSSGISGKSAGGIMAMLAPLAAGALGREVVPRRLDAGGLTDLMLGQKRALLANPNLPAGLSNMLETNGDIERIERVEKGEYVRRDVAIANAPARPRVQESKFPLGTLLGALALAALLIGGFLWMRNRRAPVVEIPRVEAPVVRAPDIIPPPAPMPVEEPVAETTVTSTTVETDELAKHFAGGPLPDRLVIPNANFVFATTELVEGGDAQIDRLAAIMKAHPNARVRIEGHTDSVGGDDVNGPLSYARAEKVKQMLIDRGVEDNCIETVGRSEKTPVATNDTDEGRLENRRFALVILQR